MKIISSIAIAAVVLTASAAQGQLIKPGDAATTGNTQAVWNSAHSGTMALRAPGNLVSNGRETFRDAHSLAISRSRFGPTIDEAVPTEPTLDHQVRSEVIKATLDNLNAGLLVLLNAIRSSGGLPPIVPGSTDLTDLLGHITNGG